MILTASHSWPVVGLVLILIGLLVKYEVKVIDSDDQEEIKPSKKVDGQNGVKG